MMSPGEQSPDENTQTPELSQHGDPADATGSSERVEPSGSPDEWEDSSDDSGSSGCLKAIAGCFGAGVILIVIVAIVGYFSWGYITDFAINQITNVVESSIDQSDLTKEQKTKLKNRVDEIKTRFKNDEISIDQVQAVIQKARPLILASTVQSVKRIHIAPSSWPDPQKKDASRALDRFTRGLSEQKIDRETFHSVMEPVLASRGENNFQLKENPSDEALKKMVKRAGNQADKHNIPDESYNFDVVSEFDQVLKDVLNNDGRKPSTN